MISFENDWLWGVPLVVITVIFHVMGLGLLDRGVTMLFATKWFGRASLFRFVVITGLSAFVATFLHAVEAVIWAYSYILIGALPGPRVAMRSDRRRAHGLPPRDRSPVPVWRRAGAAG